MRITNSMMVDKFLSDSNEALNRVARYQSQVDSTKRLNGISDDPQATLTALKARNKLSNLALYKANISTASGYLKEVESSVNNMNEVVQSAYDDIMAAISGAKTKEDYAALAEDLTNLQDEVVSIAKSSIGTSYIFGGFNFTGSTNAGVKTPPFTVNEATDDLIYNGINLSQFAWQDDYGTAVNQMTDLANKLFKISDSYSATDIDVYAKEQAQSAADTLNQIIEDGEAALKAAREFGVGSSDAAYTALDNFLHGSSGLTVIADKLNNEVSKELAGSYILDTDSSIVKNGDGSINYDYYQEKGISVLTLEELDNKFGVSVNYTTKAVSTNVASGLLSDAVNALGTVTSSGTPPTNSFAPDDLSPLTTALSTAMTALLPADAAAKLATESKNRAQLQVGADQTMDITFNGIDLLGSGGGNIYHLLGKAVTALQNGADADELTAMVTQLQNAQSNVLTLETKVGTMQNRLTFLSNRYDKSELNYTEMRSNAEDADMAEAIMNLTSAQTVYNAALAGGAEILKTSLIDFLR
jgi:flagellar hook-associated protein 3 FlgL